MEHYEIQVGAHLDKRRAAALGCELVGVVPDGRSVLTFAAADQAALYGLLSRLRDAGIELVALARTEARGCQHVPAPQAPADRGDSHGVAAAPKLWHGGGPRR